MCLPPDHPRSRGVYLRRRYSVGNSAGSSPLARGLRRERSPPGASDGIIPARAGFTDTAAKKADANADHPRSRGVYRQPTCKAAPSGDHPRSRGVYTADTVTEPHSDGSSPLARGLQGAVGARREHPGIIPARAGFTASKRRPGPSPRDHPRSRGVYACPRNQSATRFGSSPLARGLPHRLGVEFIERGIIPARAGFTTLLGDRASST